MACKKNIKIVLKHELWNFFLKLSAWIMPHKIAQQKDIPFDFSDSGKYINFFIGIFHFKMPQWNKPFKKDCHMFSTKDKEGG